MEYHGTINNRSIPAPIIFSEKEIAQLVNHPNFENILPEIEGSNLEALEKSNVFAMETTEKQTTTEEEQRANEEMYNLSDSLTHIQQSLIFFKQLHEGKISVLNKKITYDQDALIEKPVLDRYNHAAHSHLRERIQDIPFIGCPTYFNTEDYEKLPPLVSGNELFFKAAGNPTYLDKAKFMDCVQHIKKTIENEALFKNPDTVMLAIKLEKIAKFMDSPAFKAILKPPSKDEIDFLN